MTRPVSHSYVAVDLVAVQRPAHGHGAAEVVGVGRAEARDRPAGLGPRRRADVEWVWTTPPISGNSRYRSRWVGVSVDGRQEPVDDAPVVERDRDEVLGPTSAQGRPLGLIRGRRRRGRRR